MATEGGETKEWVAVQKKTFTKWVNNHLKKGGFPQLGTLENEFTDGINLMNIVHALYKLPFPKHVKNPKLNPQKFDNISQALQMVTDAKIKTNFLKTNHLFDKDLKMILGMIWSIILDYAIKGISVEDSTAKEGLLIWCRKKTAGYRDIDPPGINNFTRDWKNGLAFCALIHRHRPDLLDYSKLDAKNNNENLELAFAVAEKDLGIPRLLDVADMATPDERSVMTYVSEYFHRFAQQGVKELAARRVAKFLQFAKGMIIQQSEYEKRAKALLEWVKSSSDQFTEYKFGENLESAKEAQAYLRNFVVSDSPPKQAERLDLETLFAEIQTELKVNDRAPYKPPEGLSPEAIEGAFGALSETQRKFGESVRVNRFKYITKQETKLSEEKINEFKESFAHFDANKNGHLDRTEFKAACTTMNVPFKDEKAFDETFTKCAEGGNTVNQEQYIRFLTELQEDRDTPEQVKASFKMMADEKDSIVEQQLMVPPLGQEDVEFLSGQMPKNEDGSLNYGAFVDANFVKN